MSVVSRLAGMSRPLRHLLATRMGLDIRRYREPQHTTALSDAAQILRLDRPLLAFDIGANTGQTVEKIRSLFKDAVIHCFEPSRSTFDLLVAKHGGRADTIFNNVGVGDQDGTLELIENDSSDMTSFLEPDDAWGSVSRRTQVPVITVDRYCRDRRIDHVDLLKIDTQGFDYQVLAGARDTIARRQVSVVTLELTLDNMYVGIARYDKVFSLMAENDYAILGFYEQHWRRGVLSWFDVAFVSPDVKRLD